MGAAGGMNHKARARTIVGRSMPRPLMRKLIGDSWIVNIEKEVARGLRQVELDARRIAIRTAANEIGERAMGSELRMKFVDAVLALEKQR
jgi:hypothetical protein